MAPGEARRHDVGPGAGPRPAQPAVEHVAAVLDHEQPVLVGDGADAVPVGTVADEVRRQDRTCARADHLGDPFDVDLKRLRVDVDERRHDAGLHQGRHVGREHQRCPGGASGHETDKVSPSSPRNARVIARGMNPDDGGAEMVTFGTESGGAVFSVGSALASRCCKTRMRSSGSSRSLRRRKHRCTPLEVLRKAVGCGYLPNSTVILS